MATSLKLVELASQAATLSSSLYSIDDTVKSTATDIENIANEVATLSTVLWRLHEAMTEDPARYTEAFSEDLKDIVDELKLVFDEIGDVGRELEKDDGVHASVVKRFFRKGKALYLKKHLEVLETTLAVMKTVLQHGCDFSPKRSPNKLLTTEPHTLREEHAILDSVFLNSRNAIQELHEIDEEYNKARASSDSHHHHHHHRHQSSSALSDIPEFPPVPDGVFPSQSSEHPTPPSSHRRDFSRRGMRLAVHMSILDMGAHSTPGALKDKWVQTSRSLSLKPKTPHRRTQSAREVGSGLPHHFAIDGSLSPSPLQSGSGRLNASDSSPVSSSSIRARGKENVIFENHDRQNVGSKVNGDTSDSHKRSFSHGIISQATVEKLYKASDHFKSSEIEREQVKSEEGHRVGQIEIHQQGRECPSSRHNHRHIRIPSLHLHRKRRDSSSGENGHDEEAELGQGGRKEGKEKEKEIAERKKELMDGFPVVVARNEK